MVTKLELLVAVQAQAAPAVTETVPVPPLEGKVLLMGKRVYVQVFPS